MARMIRQMNSNKPENKVTMSNPFIGDNFFKNNPDKVLGEQSIVRGRYEDQTVIKVKGTIANLDKIGGGTSLLDEVDVFQKPIATTEPQSEIIQQVFENEIEIAKTKRVNKIRGKKEIPVKASTDIKSREDQHYLDFLEVSDLYNEHITDEEMQAYYLCNPELNYRHLLPEGFTYSSQQLMSMGLICFDPEIKKLVYRYTYQSGNINRKIVILRREKEKLVEKYGAEQYTRQEQFLKDVKPVEKTVVGKDKIVLLPHASFVKDFFIEELKFNVPELGGETSLSVAFTQWLKQLNPDSFKRTTSYEIIHYYLENNNYPIDKSMPKEWQAKEKAKEINLRQRTKEEGDEKFAFFLENELLEDDQARLAHIWNEKYNSLAEVNLSKIPVCFRIAATFKDNQPFKLNLTQRQGIAFAQEKKSAGFAYSVGVGKTACSIGCWLQAYYNGFAKKGIFVVPTSTYVKWMGEMAGWINKETGVYSHGLLPKEMNVVGLSNLNADVVRNTVKDYSDKELKEIELLEEAVELVKGMTFETKKGFLQTPNADQERALTSKYHLPIQGMYRQLTQENEDRLGNGKKIKTFKEYLIGYLRESVNWLIYSTGRIKMFSEGTVFVTTEVGLQRLGVNESEQDELVSRLFTILSQGERSGEKGDKRDVAKLQVKIEKTVASSLKNAKLDIKELGVEWAAFDEGHQYKRLFTFVKGAIKGEREDRNGKTKTDREKSKYELKSGGEPSGRALSAFVLSHYIQSNHKNRNVVHLTATPFTNSPLEVFSMLTLTNYSVLEEYGLDNMVEFFDTFMRINYDIKYTAQKRVVKDVVLTGYNNLPQLRQFIYTLWDKREATVIMRPNLIKYPSERNEVETTIPMTAEQELIMANVKKYIRKELNFSDLCFEDEGNIEEVEYDGMDDQALVELWEKTTEREFEGEADHLSDAKRETLIEQITKANKKSAGVEVSDNDEDSEGVRVLKSLNIMRAATLSPHLYYKSCRKSLGQAAVTPTYKEYIESSPKLLYVMGCIKSVIDFHRTEGTKISGQVIYMNTGVEYFALIKEYLVKVLFLQEHQVGIVSSKVGKAAKETIKKKFLLGDILVLIGSSTISVGVDLQNNATVLYNCYYDWNPTDAAQIEGRIWRQGNRFANVRVVYPMCFNSADPIIFEYLSSKTRRINEIWNRSSTDQELDLRDFDPKEFQKKLITDPEEKADWEILEEQDRLQGDLIFATNRREALSKAMSNINAEKRLKPQAIDILNQYHNTRLDWNQREGAQRNERKRLEINDRKLELLDKYASDPEKLQKGLEKIASDLAKVDTEKYDYASDPEGRYKHIDYSDATEEELAKQANNWATILSDMDYKDSDRYGDLYYAKGSNERLLSEYYYALRDAQRDRKRILEPMGITADSLADPIEVYEQRLRDLNSQMVGIENSRDDRIRRIKAEILAQGAFSKTVADRVHEFASANAKLIPPQLNYSKPEETKEEIVNAANPVIHEKIMESGEASAFITEKDRIMDALKLIKDRSASKEHFVKNVKALGEEYKLDITGAEFKEALKFTSDKKHNDQMLGEFYDTWEGIEKRLTDMEEVKETYATPVEEPNIEDEMKLAETEAANKFLESLSGYGEKSVKASFTKEQWAEYEENENDNYHSENTLIEAKLTGDPVLIAAAQFVLDEQDKSEQGLDTPIYNIRKRLTEIMKVDLPFENETVTEEPEPVITKQSVREAIEALDLLIDFADKDQLVKLKKEKTSLQRTLKNL
jgi:hypothetical protein